MGFFDGLVEGFVEGRRMKAEKEERDYLREYRKQQQAMEMQRFEWAKEDRLTAKEMRERELEWKTEDRDWTKEERDWTREERYLQRQKELRAAAKAAGGIGATSTGGTSKSGAPAVDALVESSTKFLAYRPEEATQEASEWWDTMSQDPRAMHEVVSEMDKLAKKGMAIPADKWHETIKIMAITEGTPAEERAAIVEQALGVDVKDAKAFSEALDNLAGLKATRITVDTSGAYAKEPAAEKNEFDAFMTTVKSMALKSKDPAVKEALVALSGNSSASEFKKMEAQQMLVEMFGTTIRDQYTNNRLIDATFAGLDAAQAMQEEVPPGSDMVEVPPGSDMVEGPKDQQVGVKTFNGWGEVEKAREEGFSGPAVVGGKVYNIDPIGDVPGLTDAQAPDVATPARSGPASRNPEVTIRERDAGMVNPAEGSTEGADPRKLLDFLIRKGNEGPSGIGGYSDENPGRDVPTGDVPQGSDAPGIGDVIRSAKDRIVDTVKSGGYSMKKSMDLSNMPEEAYQGVVADVLDAVESAPIKNNMDAVEFVYEYLDALGYSGTDASIEPILMAVAAKLGLKVE